MNEPVLLIPCVACGKLHSIKSNVEISPRTGRRHRHTARFCSERCQAAARYNRHRNEDVLKKRQQRLNEGFRWRSVGEVQCPVCGEPGRLNQLTRKVAWGEEVLALHIEHGRRTIHTATKFRHADFCRAHGLDPLDFRTVEGRAFKKIRSKKGSSQAVNKISEFVNNSNVLQPGLGTDQNDTENVQNGTNPSFDSSLESSTRTQASGVRTIGGSTS